MPSFKFQQYQQANQLRTCKAPGCHLPRHSINLWCRAHFDRAELYGHPHARPLKRSTWSLQREKVESLLDRNADHPGLQSALSFLASWSAQAAANEQAFNGAEEIARLVRHGVTPKAILVEVCACLLWLDQNPLALPDDLSRDVALSRAVFGLAPRARRQTRGPGGYWPVTRKLAHNHSYSPKPRRSSVRYVGPFLRQALAAFIANVGMTLEAEALRQQEIEAAKVAPLK